MNQMPMIGLKRHLFSSLFRTLSNSFPADIIDSRYNPEEMEMEIPYDFELRLNIVGFDITLEKSEGVFGLFWPSAESVSRSHYINFIRFRAMVEVNCNGQIMR